MKNVDVAHEIAMAMLQINPNLKTEDIVKAYCDKRDQIERLLDAEDKKRGKRTGCSG